MTVSTMKKSLLILPLALLAVACGNDNKPGTPHEGKGGRMYGGTLRFNETDKFQTLYPNAITDAISNHVASQIFEGLVKFDPRTLKIVPGIAEKWEVDESGTEYTFHLRKDARFHDDACFADGKGREVTADDVKFSFENLCRNVPSNQNFGTTFKDRIVGANDFYNQGANAKEGSLTGITVVDKHTLKIKLVNPNISFLYVLANTASSIFPKEAVDKYGDKMHVGTGPFMVGEIAGDSSLITLVKNVNYYGKDTLGNQLPFLDTIKISFIDNKKAEIELFEKGELDFVWGLSAEAVKTFLPQQIANFETKPPKYILDHSSELVTQIYAFNTARAPFNDVRVRKAFNMAIDRNHIVDEVLAGEAFGPGLNGICPPALPGYKANEIKGYGMKGATESDTKRLRDSLRAEARKLMAQAGYPDGKGFPDIKLVINSGGGKNTRVAEEIQNQLREVLNVNLEIANVSYKQKLSDEMYGRADMYRTAWVADYPSPETFLSLFYGADVPDSLDKPAFPNSSRYKSAAFDSLFNQGRTAKSTEESNALFFQAEQIMMNDAPAMILWYDENYRLSQSHVKNFYTNPMRYLDFSQVYLKKAEEKKEEKKEGEEKKTSDNSMNLATPENPFGRNRNSGKI
ncbi:MAG: ABC transporter substrate-binding protein [Bacteroidia bacterium]